MKICSVDLCDKPIVAKELCNKHYQRMYRKGTLELFQGLRPILPLQRQRQSQIEEAFFKARKVVKPYRDSLEF